MNAIETLLSDFINRGGYTFEDAEQRINLMLVRGQIGAELGQALLITAIEKADAEDAGGEVSNERLAALENRLLAVTAVLADKDMDFETLLTETIDALKPIPEAGEDWDAEKWYRQGDTVTHEHVLYVAVKTCKGREPGTDADYWAEAEDESARVVLVWADMASGESIEAGAYVSHNDAVWVCLKTHGKSVIRQPSAVQTEYWEAC